MIHSVNGRVVVITTAYNILWCDENYQIKDYIRADIKFACFLMKTLYLETIGL